MTKEEAKKEKEYLKILLKAINENPALQDIEYIDSILDRMNELNEILTAPPIEGQNLLQYET
jgi:ribosome assembly protein YihI (activator of Der GTPase)